MTNAQEWLDTNFPLDIRKYIYGLDIARKNLEGPLKLSGFTKLEYFRCSGNDITELNWGDSTRLKTLKLSNNKLLTKIDVSKLKQLEFLSCFLNNCDSLKINKNVKILLCNDNELSDMNELLEIPVLRDFNNKGFSREFLKKLLLKQWFSYFRLIDKNFVETMGNRENEQDRKKYEGILGEGIMDIIDTSDLDDWVKNYDFSQEIN